MRYAVILAGGAGKRLWPLSRENRPKQLLPFIQGKSLLELAMDRLRGIFDPRHVLVVTSRQYAPQAAAALKDLPPENVIGEPEGRDTAGAIALAAEILWARNEKATMAVFTADQVIRPAESFAAAVRKACDVAERERDALLTFGVRPNWPHTGLGYIHCGATVEPEVHKVLGFKEKPNHPTARRYVESGEYYWNSGMFIWTLEAIRKALGEFLPDTLAKLSRLAPSLRQGTLDEAVLREVYSTLERISIDYAVMEKAHKVLMVELRCEWLDVGSWPALESVSEPDGSGNVVIAPKAVLMDTSRSIVVSEDDHLMAVLGVDDCIVVHSPDATLVCSKSDALRLKELVAQIEKKYGRRNL